MAISVFDLFSIGIGPSSSHTVGPMRAARRFVAGLRDEGHLGACERVMVELFGSLGHTGKGHGSDLAVVMGLLGETPEGVEPDTVPERFRQITEQQRLELDGGHVIKFRKETDIVFHRRERLPAHPNGMRFSAFDAAGELLRRREYYSVGGGFVVGGDVDREAPLVESGVGEQPYGFRSGAELLRHAEESGLSISTLMLKNESIWRTEQEIYEGLLGRWEVMRRSVQRGCEREGILPGGLKVRRRAPAWYRRLKHDPRAEQDPMRVIDWVNLYALAVNEENAAGGRVVTAPTNGAAGIIPAVIHYYRHFCPNSDEDGVVRFLLVAGAIGILYKLNASISGAEVGCQGEVGVACSMAAAGLTEVLGGTPEQVENAAEIGMEHNLGLTCDPVGGLVQVPCIERNAMGSIKAINAARLALSGDGQHNISLDKVIATMRATGADMNRKYKETARGGLAVNIIEC
ncbi:MAG: L-serine ammonia-lyase [Polyangiaceae bacterium]|nr:L-serine ammonia-lyase [Polyangiaceae bacterium]MCW5792577.1 L-serine ammonia-lyase [Polyangiaceae bacterium]